MNKVQRLLVVTFASACLLAAVATFAFASVRPGDIITIKAEFHYSTKAGEQTLIRQCTLIVCPALLIKKPVYVTNGWKRVVSPQGETTYVFYNPMTDGMLVRGFVLDQGMVRLVDGIQTSDGQILVGTKAYPRVQGPGG
jgi:hypothetical protein